MKIDRRKDSGEFYPGGVVITVRPIVGGGDMRHEDFTDVAKLPARYTDKMMHDKINEVIGLLKGPSAAIALLLGAAAFGAGVTVQTAPKDEVFNDEPIVTNVVFDATGLATTGELESTARAATNYTDSATNSLSASLSSQLSQVSQAATNYTDSAIAAVPTKSQLDEGWWSEWTILRDGVDVTVPQPAWQELDPGVFGWVPTTSHIDGDTVDTDVCSMDEDATSMDWLASNEESNSILYTATRHRVAAPVPTKPEDIGAASTNDLATLSDYNNLSDKPQINGHTLTNNQTGASLGLLDKSGGMAVGTFGVLDPGYPDGVPVFSTDGTDSGLPTMRFGDSADVVGITWRIVDGYVVMDVSDLWGTPHRIALPSTAGTLALISNLAAAATAATNYTDSATNSLSASLSSQLSQLSQSLDGKVPTSRTINGKALTSNISLSAAEVGATTPADVTAAIREQSLGGIWDAELEVWWTPRMRSGSLTYEATTNVNLNAVN